MCFIAVAFSCDIVKFIFIRFFYKIKLLLYKFFSLIHANIIHLWRTCDLHSLGWRVAVGALTCPAPSSSAASVAHHSLILNPSLQPAALTAWGHNLLGHLHHAGHAKDYMSMMLQQTMQKNFTLLVCIHIIKSEWGVPCPRCSLMSDMLGTLSVLSVGFCGFTGTMHMNDSKQTREHLYKKETNAHTAFRPLPCGGSSNEHCCSITEGVPCTDHVCKYMHRPESHIVALDNTAASVAGRAVLAVCTITITDPGSCPYKCTYDEHILWWGSF